MSDTRKLAERLRQHAEHSHHICIDGVELMREAAAALEAKPAPASVAKLVLREDGKADLEWRAAPATKPEVSMSNQYNFDFRCYYKGFDGGVFVDTAALYGYWEYKDGTEGGGLWFEKRPDGNLELLDYDGWYILPAYVATLLRESGFIVDETFD